MSKSPVIDGRSGHVLVLGRDIRAFLTVIRSLGRASLTVHVGMCPSDDLALKSKYIRYIHRIPDYDSNSRTWIETVISLAREYSFDLIIPTHDESAIPIQVHRNELRQFAPVYCLDEAVFDIAFDKIKSSLLVESLGIRVPKQLAVQVSALNDGLPEGFTYPVVIKPPSSYTEADLGSRREVVVASNQAQLVDIAKKIANWGSALIQDKFEGIGTGIEVLVNAGEIQAAFQHIRVHEPRGGGASSYRKSNYPINPELYEATERLMRNVKYTGIAMVEYKINPITGDWIFIEINGRFWGSLPLAVASGADFPRLLYCQQVEGSLPAIDPPRNDIYCRNLKRDLYWAIDNLKDRMSTNPSMNSIPMGTVLYEFLRLLTFREHVDSFARDDLAPGLSELREVLAMMASKIRSIVRRQFRACYPIRRRRLRKIRQLAHSSNQILFVCSGNICRSPFAAHYAKQILPEGINILSSGFHTVTNRGSPAQAISSARELGVDLSTHRSTTIDETVVEQSDLIFVFEQKNLDVFCAAFPRYRKKVHFLGDFVATMDFEIEDPYGGGDERFRHAYLTTVHALDRLARPM